MKTTTQQGDLGRYSVEVELVTTTPHIRRQVSQAYGGEPKTWMTVFAYSPEDARAAAVERSKTSGCAIRP
jgi:hypothetical protein